LYAALACSWFVLSDRIVAAAASSLEQQAAWTTLKDLGFVAVTTALLYIARKRTGDERLAAEERTRQAQKMETIGRLAGSVAHDFNNLLTVILSVAQALDDDLRAGTLPRREDVLEIRAAGDRASDLTRQLLAFARKQVAAPEPVDLNAVVVQTEKLLSRLLGEDIELTVDLQPGLWRVRCGPGQLEQVIMNLAVNARDAMPRGGTLTIETHNSPSGAHRAAQGSRGWTGDWVRLVVRDSGTGMAPEVKARLSEPFFTTKAEGRGTGLGLATVYGIVEQSGGHVHVDTEPNRGTTFELRFPRTEPAGGTPAVDIAPSPSGGLETVLVVEDDPFVRDVAARALRRAGYRVLVAESSAEALEVVAREDVGVQIVVSDVVLPGVDERELVEELRSRSGGELRALYISGYTHDVISRHGVLDSGVAFLPKPFTAEQLLARVRTLLDAR
jgi:two-component system cell cycle sensor histidine kinase/response regulator CckA